MNEPLVPENKYNFFKVDEAEEGTERDSENESENKRSPVEIAQQYAIMKRIEQMIPESSINAKISSKERKYPLKMQKTTVGKEDSVDVDQDIFPLMPDFGIYVVEYDVPGLPKKTLYCFSSLGPGAWLACINAHGRYHIASHAPSAIRLPDSGDHSIKVLTRDSVQVDFPWGSNPVVYVKGVKIGSLPLVAIAAKSTCGRPFTSRFVSSNDTGIYYLSGTNLVYYTWASLTALEFNAGTVLQTDALDFDLTTDSYVCITNRNTLTKDNEDVADIKSNPSHERLTTVAIVGSQAICSGTVKGNADRAVVLAYQLTGTFQDSVTVQVMRNCASYCNDGICWIRPAGARHGHAAFIAVERYRYVHLVAVDSHGKLSVRSRVDVGGGEFRRIMCVSQFDAVGEFIVGGWKWIKKISVNM